MHQSKRMVYQILDDNFRSENVVINVNNNLIKFTGFSIIIC